MGCKKRINIQPKKVDFKGELTKAENEVLDMLVNQYLTPKQIAIKRRTSYQAVSKIVVKIKRKGYLKTGYQRVEKTRPTINNLIRLHGQEFNIKIINKDNRYMEILKTSNLINIDCNQVRLYKNSIEIYCGQSFYAEDPQKATSKSMKYFNRLITQLEHRLKIILIKPFKQNIKLVNAHYSETNNELAEDCQNKADKVRVYSTDDGKLWFLIDNSFNLHEAECVHPSKSKGDMEKVKDFFNDVRDRDYIKLSEISRYMADTTKQINEISHGLKAIVDYLGLQIPKPSDTKLERADYIM